MCSLRRVLSARRGSIGVESAIFLPVFLIGILTLAYLIRIAAIQEGVHHSFSDEVARVAAEGTAPVHAIGFSGNLKSRLQEENSGRIRAIKVSPFLCRAVWMGKGRLYEDLVGGTVSWEARPTLPPILRGSVVCGDTVVARAFTGTEHDPGPMPFSDMEKDGDGTLVWVFPRAGEKYHGEDCTYIKNSPREMLLTPELKREYRPCKICRPDRLKGPCLVYCFPKAGSVYHTGSCYIVDRYVISMDEKDAKEKGYTPCSKCGGH